jgi:hypothetical protein
MNYPQLPAIRLDKERFSLQRAPMVGTIPLFGVAVALLTAAGCSQPADQAVRPRSLQLFKEITND